MIRPSSRQRLTTSALLLSAVTLAAVAGCEERVGQPSPPPPQPAQTVVEGAGSAAGKALESGHKLEDKVNEHNKQLEKQIEEIGKD